MTPQIEIDPAVEAGIMTDRFNSISNAVDEFRISGVDLTREESTRLKDEAQALETRAHFFTAEAIGDTLLAIQSDLREIKAATLEADGQLRVLKDVTKAISIATSALSLGTAISAGNPGSILAATRALEQSLAQ